MADDDNVKPLPVKFKAPPTDEPPFLKIVHYGGPCNHRYFWRDKGGLNSQMVNVTYLIREGETEVECSNCNTKLDPMWVLRLMATEENHWQRQRERYIDEMKRLRERSRTKCMKCGYLTEISRR